MKNICIIYWSGTGNTKKMAELIDKGVTEKGESSKLTAVLSATVEDVNDADILVLGSPSMGSEVVEETEMEPFIESIKEAVKGKSIALFGSYGWGDGEWMRNWEERMLGYGANLVQDSLIVNECPEGDDEIRCIEFGKSLI